MESVIPWVAYVGGWLLVAGPLLQSRVELLAERQELVGFRDRMHALPVPRAVSRWWWLLPPVAWWLNRTRQREVMVQVLDSLSSHEQQALAHYIAVSKGWLFVAAGALLIATKETWELVHHQHWSTGTFWALVVTGALVASGLAAGAGELRRPRRD